MKDNKSTNDSSSGQVNESTTSIEQEHWFISRWRPTIAYTYVVILIFDFIIGPIFWAILQAYLGVDAVSMWQPLTMASGGVFHAAIGAILGVSAFTRGQEKIERLRRNFNREEHNNHREDEEPSE